MTFKYQKSRVPAAQDLPRFRRLSSCAKYHSGEDTCAPTSPRSRLIGLIVMSSFHRGEEVDLFPLGTPVITALRALQPFPGGAQRMEALQASSGVEVFMPPLGGAH